MSSQIMRSVGNKISNQWIKIIASGSVIEVYRYEKMPMPAKFEKEEIDDHSPDPERRKETDYQSQNDRRAKWNFIRLVNSNFGQHSKFVTLTFAENIQDLDIAHREFKKFIQRMRRRYDDFKYALAIEFQQRGAVHYHLMSDLPYIPKNELAEIWRQGFVRINDIQHVDNVGAYLSKYMTKGEGRDCRLQGRKMYLTSKNMERPQIFKGDEADKLLEIYELQNKKTVLESCYLSEHHGLITYKQYNLKRVQTE